MSGDGDKPSYVRALEEFPDLGILSWGGTEIQGSVEWRSKDHDGTPMRNCRRWAVVAGKEFGHHVTQTEQEIELSDGRSWQELMKQSALEFQRYLRDNAVNGARKTRRR